MGVTLWFAGLRLCVFVHESFSKPTSRTKRLVDGEYDILENLLHILEREHPATKREEYVYDGDVEEVDFTEEEIAMVLDEHNKYRNRLGASNMKYMVSEKVKVTVEAKSDVFH